MPPLVMTLVFNRIETTPMPFFVKPIAKKIAATVKNSFLNPEIMQQLNYMETEVAKTGWFAGAEFTAADIQMSFPLEAAASRGGLGASYPKLNDFLERIHGRPAYKRALKRGGTYDLLK
jgi:glutathione S-transferase